MNKAKALQILELPAGATLEEIKQAYRKLAMKHHPDRNQGNKEAEEKFKEIKAAFEYLENPAPEGPFWRAAGVGPGVGPININDIFDAVFRGGDWFDRAARPPSYVHMIHITLREAFEGCTKKVKLPALLGPEEKTFQIPAGISHGEDLGYAEGIDGRGQRVLIRFQVHINTGTATVIWPAVASDSRGDVHDAIEVSAVRMMLGGFVEYQTLEGATIQLRVPAGMGAGKKLKLKEKGYWRQRAGVVRGDVYLTVIPRITLINRLPAEELKELRGAVEAASQASD